MSISDGLSHPRLEGVRIACPPLPRNAGFGVLDLPFSLELRSSRQRHPIDAIGLELRVAFTIIASGDSADDEHSFWRRKCRELILRPAVEPLLLAHWSKLKSLEMTELQVASFSSLQVGSKVEARTKHCYGLWDGGNVRFEAADQARTWWKDIQAVASEPELASILPAYAFARTIIAHPYPDGNGRLARALVHASLARTAGLSAPALPLAPAFYLNATEVAAGLRNLSATGDWNAFSRVFDRVLGAAVALVRRHPC